MTKRWHKRSGPRPPVVQRRLQPDGYAPGVWVGPEWCLPPGSAAEKQHGPRVRIYGRWLPAVRASYYLYVKRGPGWKREMALLGMRERMGERAMLTRWTDCPF